MIKNLALLCGLLLSAFLLYLPPEIGSALAIPPDSSEYAISLVNLFEHGTFGFTINGSWYPSRYSPWFSITCLTPAYILGGGNPFCFHWAILGFSLALLATVYKWGQRLGLGWMSVIPSVMLMFVPDFVFYSRVVMTEIPYAALFAVSALTFAWYSDTSIKVSCRSSLACGLVVAWGGAVRPTMFPMLLPYAIVAICRQHKNRLACITTLLSLVAPTMIYGLLNLIYNWVVFSTPFRSGYHYWMPIPSDYPSLVFNITYIQNNIKDLLSSPLFQITFALILITVVCSSAVIVARKRCREYGDANILRLHVLILIYFLFQGVVLLILYIPYYWPDYRFFLVLPFCILPLTLSSLKLAIAETSLRLAVSCAIVIVGLATSINSNPKYHGQPLSRQRWYVEGQIALQKIPDGAMIIQGGDANVFDHFGFRVKNLTLQPYDRDFDYARHMIAPVSIQGFNPKPKDCWQRNIPELIEQGVCKTPFPETVSERPSLVLDWIRQGRRVFISRDAIRKAKDWIWFLHQIEEIGLALKRFGSWSAPGIPKNMIRRYYDGFVLARCPMDYCPTFSCELYEIVDGEPSTCGGLEPPNN